VGLIRDRNPEGWESRSLPRISDPIFPAMDRRRSPDSYMAPVLARLVRSLAILSMAAGISIVVHSCVWATLCFTEVRSHGLDAVTHPERVQDSGRAEGPTTEAPGGIVSVKSGSGNGNQAGSQAGSQSGGGQASPQSAADSSAASRTAAAEGTGSTSDRILGFVTSIATIVGVACLSLLPIVLVVAFITALMHAPRAANSSMAGILWATITFAMVLPWETLWPQVPWPGLFVSYQALILETDALRSVGNPFTLGVFLSHVATPAAVIAVLIGLAWRCGEPLHAELLAAESLQVDPEIDQDAAAVARKGPTIARSRNAAGLAAATTAAAAMQVDGVEPEEPSGEFRMRRLI
jgi:hypothetical protein